MKTTTRDAGTGERRRPVTGWALREARADDLAAVRALLEQSELPVEGVEDHFRSAYVVVDAGKEIIGSAGIEVYGRYGLLRSLTVAPVWQRAGIGRAMTEDRLEWAKSRGLIAVFLLTFKPDYFVQFGFQPVRRDSVPPEIRESAEFSSICPQTSTVMALPVEYTDDDLREGVRNRYAAIAREASPDPVPARDAAASCCGPDPREIDSAALASALYTDEQLSEIPREAALLSLGCGNPMAVAALKPGEVVLDLGSGGGLDVLLSARRVGPSGKAYGLDMTDEMLEIARANQEKAGITNAEFLKGEIEAIPLPDATVDIIISNCVINLSTDKRRALSEAFRVLKPGGRFSVSDIVANGPVPEAMRRDVELWAGCLAGSLEERKYRDLLEEVGFEAIEFEPITAYGSADTTCDCDCEDTSRTGGMFKSSMIRARKPGG